MLWSDSRTYVIICYRYRAREPELGDHECKMESQDLRVTRLEELLGVMVENQTATLRLLNRLNERVDDHALILKEHSAILKEHSAILKEHSAILKEHSAILKEHSTRLENLENLMSRVLNELVEIKELLAARPGMGFSPEPAGPE